MLKINKTINISGTSYADTEGKNPIAYFSAQIQQDGKKNVNYSIQNAEFYSQNKELFRSDKLEFENEVEKI